MEQNRRARIVKRAPLYKRIIDAPEDYLTKVENDLRALDWDLLQEGFRYQCRHAAFFAFSVLSINYLGSITNSYC